MCEQNTSKEFLNPSTKIENNLNVIIVLSSEEAEKLALQIPNSVVVQKIKQHVEETGNPGFVGAIKDALK